MMKSYTSLLLALLLLLSSFSLVSAQDQDRSGALIPGTIAFVGDDLNIYTISPADGIVHTLTDDASISRDAIRYYRWPTWATDNRLAYFSVEETSNTPYTTGVYVTLDSTNSGELVYQEAGEIFNYASWAPQNCSQSNDCRDLAILLSGQAGLFVEVVKSEVEDNPSETVGRGGPFYYSWSPSGAQMLWQRNNRRLDIYDLGSNELNLELDQQPGIFQAPHWSPVDDRWLIGKYNIDTQTTDLVIATINDEQTLVSGMEGNISFLWSPDGNYIAYTNQQGPLIVIDSATGEVVSQTVTGGVVSFFWSPDSTKLAFVTLDVPPGAFSAKAGVLSSPAPQESDEVNLAWSILDVQNGDIDRYGAFVPSNEQVYMFTYFDQFAQSHRVWSPDSRYIVYSEINDDAPIISIIDTQQEDTVPITIAEGFLAVWSFN